MRTKAIPLDALGSEVVLGNTYGYSVTSPGSIQRTVLGKAIAAMDYRVQLEVLSVKEFTQGKKYVPQWEWESGRTPAKKVTIAARLVFPVDPNKVPA